MKTLQEQNEQLVTVNLDELAPPTWILRPIKNELVDELERSIQNAGLLQPIVVRKKHAGYEVVFGNHRLQACRRLGIKRIKTLVKSFDDDESFLARISENLIRNTYVDPMEEARGYKMLVGKGWTINAIGRKVGKCDSYISERLGLLKNLSERVRSEMTNGSLTPSHAELISRIKDRDIQNEMAELVKKRRLSVRSLESILKNAPPPTKIRTESNRDDEYTIKIPKQFAQAMGFKASNELFAYMQGKKLVLENVTHSQVCTANGNHSL